MIFLSPGGINANPPGWEPKNFIIQAPTIGKKVVYSIVVSLWERLESPFSFFKLFGRFGSRFLQEKWWMRRFSTKDEQGKIKFARFLRQSLLRHASSDKCLKYIF